MKLSDRFRRIEAVITTAGTYSEELEERGVRQILAREPNVSDAECRICVRMVAAAHGHDVPNPIPQTLTADPESTD